MVRRLRKIAVVAALLALTILLPTATASAASPSANPGVSLPQTLPNGPGQINNAWAIGKCIGIDKASQAGDWFCTTNADQTWHWDKNHCVEPSLGVWCAVVNGNNQCLATANGGSAAPGTKLIQFSCVYSEDQMWQFVNNSDGTWRIFNFKGFIEGEEVLIGVAGGSTANGAALVLWRDTGDRNQDWY